MARETKAQREERLRNEAMEELKQRQQSYQPNLMHQLVRASKLGITFFASEPNAYVEREHFVVSPGREHHKDEWSVYPLRLSMTYDIDSYNNLLNLESYLDFLEEERREYLRKEEVRKNAIAKLNAEEREVLGVK